MNKKDNKTKITTSLSLIVIFSLLITACKQGDQGGVDPGLRIVTTTGMIKDAAEQVAGERAGYVRALMGPGVDPHLYKATQGDLEEIENADIVFYNGLHLEGKMGELFEKLKKRGKPMVVEVSEGIPDSLLRKVPGFQGAHDPHIWFDVALWEHAVKQVSKSLQEFDSAASYIFIRNEKKYLQQLDSLDAAVRQSLQVIPKEQRVLITAHDAFGYYGDAYDIQVRGLQGISTVSEFGLKDVTDLVTFIIERKIKAIFVETSVSQKSIEAVVEGCKQKGWDVKIGGSLFSDAMGNAGTPEGTYIGMVSANTNTIVNALK